MIIHNSFLFKQKSEPDSNLLQCISERVKTLDV